MSTEETTPKRRWRPKFSLLTLVLGVVFVGACCGLWWRWEPWVLAFEGHGHSGEVWAAIFSPTGDSFCTVSNLDSLPSQPQSGPQEGYHLIVWDTELRAKRFEDTHVGHLHEVTVAYSPGGRWIWEYLGSYRVPRSVWSAKTGQKTLPTGTTPFPFLPSGFLTGEIFLVWSNELVLMDSNRRLSLPETHSILVGQSERLVAYDSMDAKYVVYRLPDLARITEWPANTAVKPFRQHWAHMSRDGAKLVVTLESDIDEGFRTTVYDTADGHTLHVFPGLRMGWQWIEQESSGSALSEDGRWVLLYDKSNRCSVYSLETGQVRSELEAIPGRGIAGALAYCFSRDGRRVLSMLDQAQAVRTEAYDADTGRRLFAVNGPAAYSSRSGVFSIDGGRCLVREEDRAVLIDADNGTRIKEFPCAQASALSPDGGWLVTATDDVVQLWRRNRNEHTYGVFLLPEFWVAPVSGGALMVIALRRLRRKASVTTSVSN